MLCYTQAAAIPATPLCPSPPVLSDRARAPQVFARWYRPPELFYGSTCYGPGVDIWAAGGRNWTCWGHTALHADFAGQIELHSSAAAFWKHACACAKAANSLA